FIIIFIAIYMIHRYAITYWVSEEGCANQSMNVMLFHPIIVAQHNPVIVPHSTRNKYAFLTFPLSTVFLFYYPTQTFYSTEIADFVLTFISSDRLPNFFLIHRVPLP